MEESKWRRGKFQRRRQEDGAGRGVEVGFERNRKGDRNKREE